MQQNERYQAAEQKVTDIFRAMPDSPIKHAIIGLATMIDECLHTHEPTQNDQHGIIYGKRLDHALQAVYTNAEHIPDGPMRSSTLHLREAIKAVADMVTTESHAHHEPAEPRRATPTTSGVLRTDGEPVEATQSEPYRNARDRWDIAYKTDLAQWGKCATPLIALKNMIENVAAAGQRERGEVIFEDIGHRATVHMMSDTEIAQAIDALVAGRHGQLVFIPDGPAP